MNICKVDSKNYITLCKMWQNTFGDSIEYIDNLYASLDAEGYILMVERNVKSCLTIFDVGTYNGLTICEIYAVCTIPEERGNGYASKLIQHVKDEIANAGKIAMVCPATVELIPFYNKLGFEEQFYVSRQAFKKNVPHINLCEKFQSFVISEGETESINLLDLTDNKVIVEGMIDNRFGMYKQEDVYPYFGFPMK